MADVELRPCPFCGSPGEVGGLIPWVQCDLCDACGPVCGTDEAAIAAWNHREPDPIYLRTLLEAANKDRAGLEADARRYRFLRGKAHQNTAYDVFGGGGHWSIGVHSPDNNLTLDAAIDRAREAGNGSR